MFTSLIESLREAVDEARLMPFSLSAQKIKAANKTLDKLRRDVDGSKKPQMNTKKKVIMTFPSRTGTDNE